MRSRLPAVLFVLALALACDAAVLLGVPPEVGQLAGLLLVFALPGAALLLAVPADARPCDLIEQCVLAFGLSLALSMLCFWLAAQVAGLGIITRWLAVESALISVLALVAIIRRPTSNLQPRLATRPAYLAGVGERPPTSNLQRSRLASIVIVMLVAAVLRFAALGYGEYYDDELDVVQSARSTLLGQTHVILEHRKGPTEIWLAAVAAGTSTRFDEATTRLPFALASLGAIATTVLLGEEFLGKRRGLLAGLLLSAEGILLAFSRMVQYQGIVALMVVLVAWCALRLWRAQTLRAETFYLASGALFWSFGTFTHWDGALSGVVLAYVVWAKWFAPLSALGRGGGGEGRFRRLGRLAIITALAVAMPAIFYLQLFLNPQSANLKQYAGERLGFGIFNGAPTFMLHATFYDASPFIIALLLLAALVVGRHLPRWRWVTVGVMALPFVWPDFLQLGAWNFSLIIFVGGLMALLRNPNAQLEFKLLFLWLFTYFIIYAFVVKSAGLHFYALMPALALLVATSITNYELRITPQVSRLILRRRRINAAQDRLFHASRVVLIALLVLTACVFDFIAYVSPQEYALNYPRNALAWSPTFYRERPHDFFFGFPYRYGWSVIGELYRRGDLRGKFQANETYLVTDWYTRDVEAARDDEPRYFFRVDDAPRGGDPPGDLAEKFHRVGEVRVYGTTKITLYENNRYAPTDLRVFNAEDFPTSDPHLLARSVTYRQASGDDQAFRDLARYLEKNVDAQDAIVLDTPLQDAIVPYYYRGAARVVAWPTGDPHWSDSLVYARTVYASLWDAGETERWLAQHLFPVESRWFGSVRLATYAPPLAESTLTKSGASFGDHIVLESYATSPGVVQGGDVLRLELHWRLGGEPLTTRYKIFVHVLDAQGQVIAQRDAEPMADLAPTTTWRAGEIITDHHGIRLPANLPPQILRLAIGFYDPQTNERLPVSDASGHRLPDDRLLIEGLNLE